LKKQPKRTLGTHVKMSQNVTLPTEPEKKKKEEKVTRDIENNTFSR